MVFIEKWNIYHIYFSSGSCTGNGSTCHFIFGMEAEKKANGECALMVLSSITRINVDYHGLPYLVFMLYLPFAQPASTRDPAREAELVSAPVSRRGHGEHLQSTENHRFTYMELEKFTNKFERFIGQGGFGLVYYGRLEDNTEVAVKMRSESSSHGLDEFLAEVPNFNHLKGIKM